MISKLLFWISVSLRFISTLFKSDKKLRLHRTRSKDGSMVCEWTNALWIELPSGLRTLDRTITLQRQALCPEAQTVLVKGFYENQSYSLTALLIHDSILVQPFHCSFKIPEISLIAERKAIRIQPIKVAIEINHVRFKSVEINHNTFSKIELL